MAIRRKRKNTSKLSQARARRQKTERRKLLLENLEDRRLLAGIPELAGIQTNDGQLLDNNDVVSIAPRELVFGFNRAAEIDPATLGAIQILQSGNDGTFNRATTTSDLNTGGDVQVLFTATAAGVLGNGTQLIFTKSDHGNASGPFVEVDLVTRTVTLDLNTHPSNSTTALGIVNAINGHADASSLLTLEITAGDPLVDVAAVEITYSPVTLAGSNDVVMEPGYVGLGDSAREVVFRFKETLADETYQVVIDGSSPLALKDLDGSVFQDGEDFTLQFELELGAQVTAVVPQPVVRDSSGALDQLRDTVYVYFNDDKLDQASAEDPAFYQLIYTRTTVDANDDVSFSPVSVDYDAQADLAVLTFPVPLTQLIDPVSGTEIKSGVFRLRVGTDETAPPRPLAVDVLSDAGSSFDQAQSVGRNLVISSAGDTFVDGQSFDIEDDQGVKRTFEFDTGDASTLAAGAIVVSVASTDTADQVTASIASAINGAGFDVRATRDGGRITLVNARMVEHADLVISGDASTFVDGQTVQVVTDSGRTDVLEVETGFLLNVPGAGSNAATEITDTQTFTVSNGTNTVTFEFDLQNGGLTDPINNVAILYGGTEDHIDMAGIVTDAINNQSLGLSAQALGGGGIHLGGTTDHALDTDNTAMDQSGQPGVGEGNVAVLVVPSAAVTSEQVAAGIVDAVNAGGLVGVTARLDGTRVFLDGVASVTSAGGIGGALLSAPVSIEQFRSIVISGEIEPQSHPLAEVGSVDEPGHRDIRVQSHLINGPDSTDGVTGPQLFSFPEQYGTDPQGNVLLNAITEEQKQRAREIFEIYGQQLGISFVEHEAPNDGESDQGFRIVTGDMRAIDPTLPIGVGGVLGVAGENMAIMDLQDFQQANDDRYGGPWFRTAMHEIGHLLGLGHTDELPEVTVMNDDPGLTPAGQAAEPIYPGDHDLVHGRQLFRPDSKDIDLYRVPIDSTGILRIETFAERQQDSSLLDTVITLYREVEGADGQPVRELVARNDDYFSEDSRIELSLNSGTYFIGISASGNDNYNPEIEDSGYGGKTQGRYDLQLTFRPDAHNAIEDLSGIALDGDGDGVSGGVFNFWFQTAIPAGVTSDPDDPRTLFVDKLASGTENGALAFPFGTLGAALAEADPGDIVRMVGNPGADGDASTLSDNVAYQFGYNRINGEEFEDGSSLLVPQGVTVMIDAGAIIKSRRGRIGVGSSSPSINRSGGALQVLGTPHLVDPLGDLLLDGNGDPIPGSVYLTSINDRDTGADSNPDQFPPDPRPGDWGGIDFRHQIDSERVQPFLYSDQGVFLDYVNQANIAYGGGVVLVDGTSEVVSSVHLSDARPTITFNTIHKSAESAISANPDSFQETTFREPSFQGIPFTPDYSRVGPAIHNNTIVENSINGLFVRISTPAGNALESLTVAGRFDDTDIVHVITENLQIKGTPGGPLLEVSTPPTTLITLEAVSNGSLGAGTYNYRIVYVDAAGNEGFASAPTRTLLTGGGSIRLENLPPATAGFTARRIYRSTSLGDGPYTQVAEINAASGSFLDDGSTRGGTLVEIESSLRSRLDASLVVDPGTIVKLDGSRIEVGVGTQLVVEGVDGREVNFTSLRDHRYGAGGTFDTSLQGEESSAALGDWSGIFASAMSHVSIDHTLLSYGGGVSRIEGTFAGFNVLEIHQAEARVAHSVFQFNADGSGGQAADRLGRGTNDQAVIFVRGAQPVILDNVIRDNLGELATEQAAAISINVNSLSHVITADPGRTTGLVDRVADLDGNQGALIRLNRLDNNAINGMVVRSGTLTTQSVWDDTDIVHVVTDIIQVTDFHSYGGLRLQSSGSESLVVKLDGPVEFDEDTGALIDEGAGFRAGGRPLEIDDRIGGLIQIIGQPRHPVILTSINDNTVGAGFTPDGLFQQNTIPGELVDPDNPPPTFPPGPEVDNGTLIDNDVDVNLVGHFEYRPIAGGSNPIGTAGQSGVTVQGRTQTAINADFIFDYINYVDVGSDGGGIDLSATTITQAPILVSPDLVRSAGNFPGANGQINWTMDSHFDNGEAILFNTLTLSGVNEQALGDLRFITYLDEDVQGISDDILYLKGTPGEADFRAFTLDGPERYGFSQGGFYELGPELFNATYTGWAADKYSDLQTIITGAGTTYSVAGNIDIADLPLFTDPDLDPVYGPADVTTAFAWNVDPAANNATIVSFLELVPQDPSTIPQEPQFGGDWNSIQLSSFSHDRNIGVVVEREGVTDQNNEPQTAQHLGVLAPHEKSGDDNQRLGFLVHGQISQPGDLDVYSFEARGGTEVWLDIDATWHALDTVVELIDVDGTVLARSDNSIQEAADPTLLLDNNGEDGTYPLEKSAHEIYDHWSTNPRDAGMRVVLPGQGGSVNTYQVRVRSSSDNLAELDGGTTSGRYELQVRLRELDEIPGSTIQFSDIRYATNAIEIFGQPVHSPLSGEIGEVENGNTAQQLGNLLTTDRATFSIAGTMADAADVDFYEFGVTYEQVQTGADSGYAAMMDIDYADGLARANTSLNVFNAAGQLILTARDSNIAEDRRGPLRGIDMQDLSRGSVGPLDPLLGTVELPGGTTYQVAVTTDSLVPAEMDQFITATPVNANLRLEPIPAVGRIVEDHINETTFSTFAPPQVPVIVGNDGIVPYHIGDVVLFVSQDTGVGQTTVRTVDGFTGALETTVGSFNRDIGDIDIRGADDRMYAFTLDLEDGNPSDGQAGNYFRIDTGDATLIDPCGGTLQDDNVQTNHEDPTNPGNPVASDVGMHYDALTYAAAGLVSPLENGFVVGHRPKNSPTNQFVTGGTDNVLYRFDPQCGQATSGAGGDRTGTALIGGAGTNIRERGILDTTVDSDGTGFSWILASEATEVAPDGTTTTLIADGTRFLIEHDGNLLTSAVEFEFNGGPEVYFDVDPANGIFVRDGDTFTLDGQPHEFNTGSVLVINAQNGSQVNDGETISITDKNGQLKNFEFDSGNGVGPGSEKIDFTSNMSQPQLVSAIINAINAVNNYTVQASTLSATSNRITLVEDSTTSNPSTTSTNIEIQGLAGGNAGAGSLMEIEETFTASQFSDAIVTRFNQLPAITVSPDGARINFSGALFGSFSEIINRGVMTDQLTDGLFGVTAVQVPFLASDTAEDIAQKMTTALNGQTIPAIQDVTVVRLDPPATVVPPIDSPLRIGGAAPGGDISGMAFIENTLYAISDGNDPDFGGGGLFVVNNPLGIAASASLDYIDTSAPFLQGIDFQGLAAGPVATEDGLYQDILFGIDSNGELYAFDTAGVLQPLFVDGATSVQTGLTNVTGLQFSTREENLWATTTDRGADPGHGLLPSYDGVRTTVTPGGSSLHFGQGLGNNIDLPGGVHGSFETRTFSLENYSAADQPVLYFNYFVETEGAAGTAMRDSFRVFVGDDSGNWDLLTTNNADPLAELDLEPAEVQEEFDGVNQWRQVRADLSSYAGVGNLRLRFDFSTAGEMNTGHEHTTGEELRTIPARELRDGQVITIGKAGPDGRWGVAGVDDDNNDIVDDSSERLTLGSDDLSNLETFEIDLGFTLVAPTGAGISDAEVFTIDYGSGISANFEFDNDGSSASAIAVPFDVTMSAAEVARAVQTAILAGVQAPVQNGTINSSSEPNDVLANAIPINLNGLSGRFVATSGEIGDNADLVTLPDADVDMLSIDLVTDTRITIDIDSENYSSNIELLNSYVRVFDSSGQELASNNTASAPGEQPGTDSYLEFSAPLDGTYYIGISGAGNTAYDPGLVESGVEGSTGSYDLEITVQTSGGYVQRSNHRVQLPGAVDVTETSGLTIEGQPGISGDFAVSLHAGMNQDAVANALRRSLAGAYAGGNLDVIKGYDQVVRVIGHSVVDAGPLGLTFQMPGDLFGDFNSNERGQNNVVEGVYMDDIVIGFAERGEMVTGAGANTTFVPNTRTEPNQVTSGPYQLELRGGSEYVSSDEDGNVILVRTFDSNDRLSEQTTIVAPAGHDIADAQTFTLSDGLHELVFEYDDDNVDDGVPQGNVEISFNPADSTATIAQRIRDAVNGDAVQSILDIRASSSDGTVAGDSGDNRVNLFGTVRTSLVDDRLKVTDVTTDANLLRDAMLGTGVTLVGDATLVGSDVSAGVFEGGLSTIGLDGGIILSTGNVLSAQGPNVADDSSSLASEQGDLDLDIEFVSTTLDSTSLEFQFETASGDIFFDFVFASEEYNEFVGSQFNDVFAFFVDGVNIALIPGASQPISINTVNGGNPLGTGASNPQFFINNDLDDGGQFLQQLGYDGFTTVFTAQRQGLAAGTHTIKLAISDVGDAILDSAVFIGASSFSDTTEVVLPVGISGERFDLLGDQNRHREQGQILIHSNRIIDAKEFGIVVDSSSRTGPDSILHQGPTRFLLELNTEHLVPGITITNNVLAGNILGGIRFQGEVNVAGEQIAAVPFNRIINNTIFGNGGGVGIQVLENTSSTILNNIVANLEIGIEIDDTSETTVLGGMLYAGNTTDFTNTNIGEGDFPLYVAVDEPLFVNSNKDNFYPAAGSRVIDSSINSLEERASLNTVKEPLGIAPSPILAPDQDGAGQERVDDPSVATPSGLGQNVFKDRGAIDRADFAGPSAFLADPEDNDELGIDRDSRVSIVEIRGVATDTFEIQLVDGVVPIDPGDGIGIDDSTVTSGAVKVFQDDIRLAAGIDYTFNYDATNDVIRLTALAGAFQQDRTYRLELANVAGFLIEPEDGSQIRDGDTFLVTDNSNLTVDFEFECGYIIEVPQAYTLIIPENGGADIVDGETFVITDDQSADSVFEMDRNGVIEEGNIAVSYTIANSPDTVADAIVSSLTAANIGLSPANLGEGQVHVGTQLDYLLDTSNTNIDQAGVSVSVIDGDIFTVDDGSTVLTFELDSDGNLGSGGTVISYTGTQTHEQIADSLSAAINGTELGLTTQHYGDGRIHVVGTNAMQVAVTDSNLQLIGQPGVRPDFGVRIPSQAGVPNGLEDGQTFTISDGTTTTTFEFDNDQNATAGNAVVRFASDSTIDSVANELVAAIQVVGLGLSPVNAGSGIVELGSDGNHVLNLGDSVLTQVGFPGVDAAVAVPFIPAESFSEGDVSESIATAINGSDLTGVSAQARIDSVVVTGAQSVSGTGVQIVVGTIDNTTEPNDLRILAVEIDLNGLSGHFVAANGEIGDNVALANAARDVDLLYIDLEADTTITIDVDTDNYTDNSEQLDSYLRVFNSLGVALISNDNATAPGELPSDDSYIKFTAPFDDTYYIGISGMANIDYDPDLAGSGIDGSVGSYDVEVTVLSVSTTNVLGSNGIRDLADNPLTPNQTDGSTVLTVVLSSGLDYGDAPDPPYDSSRESNGPTHEVVAGYHLGAGVDVETDAKSNANASGDTDDGVSFTSGLAVGFDSQLTVTVAGVTADRDGILDAWIDFDHDGDWSLDERVISQSLAEGDNQITFTIPSTALVGDTFARFRLSSTGTADPNGPAVDGEVEDYQVTIGGNPWRNNSRPLDVNNDTHVSPIDALQIITALNDGKAGLLPVPPTAEFSPPPFLDVNGDGHLSPLDALLVIDELNNPSSGEGEGEGEGEPAGWVAPRDSRLGSQHLVMAEASSIPQLSDFIPRRQSSLVMPAGDATAVAEVDSRRVDQTLSGAVERQAGSDSDDLDDVLQLIGEDLSDVRETDAHDDYFASLRY